MTGVFPRVAMTTYIALSSDWFLEFFEFAVPSQSRELNFRLVFRGIGFRFRHSTSF